MDVNMTETTVRYLQEYNFEYGTLIKTGKVNSKVRSYDGKIVTVRNEKIAFDDESVCVVWERWKGRNGRGAYRVERELYPQDRIPAKNVARQGWRDSGRVTESSHGVKE